MERKFEIPTMSEATIRKWYSTIRPIVHQGSNFTFLRKLSNKELSGVAYTWLDNPKDYAENVDFSKLSFLADVKMLHTYGYYGLFKPSVGEVIRQIPADMLEKAVAFEIIYSPVTWADFEQFKAEFDAGFHVSIVRLYKNKDDTIEAVEPIGVFSNEPVWRPATAYPTENSVLPIGMTEEEFGKFKKFIGQKINN